MNTIFNDVCVLVAAAFALTLVPGFRNLERSLLSRCDQGAVLLVFTILGLVEEAAVSDAGLLHQRSVLGSGCCRVAFCSSSLLIRPRYCTGSRRSAWPCVARFGRGVDSGYHRAG